VKITAVLPHVVVQRLEQPFGMSQWLWDVRSSCLVEVVTDDGVIGWGECFGPAEANRALIESVYAPLLVGRDAGGHIALWEAMYNRSREWGRKGLSVTAISGIEIALLDLAGKAAGLPVHRLLGGLAPAGIPAYASSFYYAGPWNGDFEAEAEHLRGQGFTAFKMKVGGQPVDEDIERVRRVRAAVGPGARLAIDANRALTAAEAVRLARGVADCDIWFFEEPVLPEDLAAYREVRAKVDMPIAGGESEYTRWGFRDLLEHRCVDLLQPDATACGGLRETLLIAGMAAAHGIPTYPHVWGSSITVAAALHLISALPAVVPSTARELPWLELDQSPNVFREQLSDLDCGPRMAVPDRPGLGVEIDRSVIEAHRI
jgi:D-galactarolactone cycloisomerase